MLMSLLFGWSWKVYRLSGQIETLIMIISWDFASLIVPTRLWIAQFVFGPSLTQENDLPKKKMTSQIHHSLHTRQQQAHLPLVTMLRNRTIKSKGLDREWNIFSRHTWSHKAPASHNNSGVNWVTREHQGWAQECSPWWQCRGKQRLQDLLALRAGCSRESSEGCPQLDEPNHSASLRIPLTWGHPWGKRAQQAESGLGLSDSWVDKVSGRRECE